MVPPLLQITTPRRVSCGFETPPPPLPEEAADEEETREDEALQHGGAPGAIRVLARETAPPSNGAVILSPPEPKPSVPASPSFQGSCRDS